MRLEDYWGIGPKTRERLESNLGAEAAIEAIESGDVRTLTEAGLSRGRATRILRRATGEGRMDLLATRDARAVYKDLLDLAADHAVTRHAGDRIRVLTPLATRAAMEDRLDDVMEAVASWNGLEEETRSRVLDVFEGYDSVAADEPAAVEVALDLREVGVSEGVFAPLSDLDPDALREAADALSAFEDGEVEQGADAKLDRLRDRLAEARDLEGSAFDVLDTVREEGVRGEDELREAVVQYLARETDLGVDAVRRATPDEAADAADFVGATLREVVADLAERADEREAEVRAELEATIEDTRDEVDAAIEAVEHVTLYVSLARFALAYDLTRPEFVESDAVAVEAARNLSLLASDEDVQPVTYAVGDHDLDGAPSEDRVAVLTGANSGGKTTLLETLCQVALLAQMGLPVPADRARVSPVDAIVFHRRHASFNAGVLESTLKSVVPPLATGDRTLMLVDEFEAITEPGSAADLLHGLVTLTVDRDALGVFVTHLADDLRPLPDPARIDGIFAEGLSEDLDLVVDYQPRFGELGRSTPEFIVSRLVANADDRQERAGFETLAGSIGEGVVQRTLSDARWSGETGD